MPGIQLKITVINSKIVRKGLQNLWKKLPLIGRKNIVDAIKKIIRRSKRYPPKRPKQKYIRTFRLRRGWKYIKSGPRSYTIVNETPYTKYVKGTAYGLGQAWMHAGRWTIFRDDVEAVQATLPKTIAENMKMVARRSA